uniref:Transport-associated OB type 2 domain-containing protein n=1 Tax=Tanacetum cinerariifolium TaxID=118510 RepID=A0A699GDW7_TANCI|nr:hypothetical protein [Tanacetum cinerariifolium]
MRIPEAVLGMTHHHRAVGAGPHRAGDPRLLFCRRHAGRLCAALRAAPRAETVCGPGLAARGGARAGVLPHRKEHRPRPAAARTGGPQRSRRDQPPGVQHRRRQRIRSAVRRHLRLLRADEPGRGHADPRDGRRPDGHQLPARRRAGAGRQPVLFQAHLARGGAQTPHVRHLHGQAHGRRTRIGHARAPERERRRHGPQYLHRRRRLVVHALPPLHRRPAALYAGGDGDPGAVRQFVPPHGAPHGRAHQRPVGHRQPHRGLPDSDFGHGPAARGKPHHRRRRQSLSRHGRHAGLRLPGHGGPHRAVAHGHRQRLRPSPRAAARAAAGAGRPAPGGPPARRAGRAVHRRVHGHQGTRAPGIHDGHQPVGAGTLVATWRDFRAARQLRLRQVDPAAHAGRFRDAHRRGDHPGRPGHRQRAAVPAPHQHDVPVVRAVPAPVGVGQHRLRAAPRWPAQRRHRRARGKDAGAGAALRIWQTQAAPAVRRPAAARGAGAQPGQASAVAAAGRTAGRPGQKTARAHPDGAGVHHRGSGRDVRDGHPRPGRSHEHGHPHRRHERRPHPAGGRAGRHLRNPELPFCRGLHRQREPVQRQRDRGPAGPRDHRHAGRQPLLQAEAPTLEQRANASEHGYNCVHGTITALAYFGNETLYHVQLDTGMTIKVSRTNAARHDDAALKRDQRVPVHRAPLRHCRAVAVADVRVFAAVFDRPAHQLCGSGRRRSVRHPADGGRRRDDAQGQDLELPVHPAGRPVRADLSQFVEICSDHHGAVPVHRLPVCVLHGARQAQYPPGAANAGDDAVLDVVPAADLRLEGHPGQQRHPQSLPARDRRDQRTAAPDEHPVLADHRHDVRLSAVHDPAAVRQPGQDGPALPGSGGRPGRHAVPGFLARDGAVVEVRHHCRGHAGVHSVGGRVRDSGAAGRPRDADDRPPASRRTADERQYEFHAALVRARLAVDGLPVPVPAHRGAGGVFVQQLAPGHGVERLLAAVVCGADGRHGNHQRSWPVAAHRADDGVRLGGAGHLCRVRARSLSPLHGPHAVCRHGERAAGHARGDHRPVAAADAGVRPEGVRLSGARADHDLDRPHAAGHGLCGRGGAIAPAGDEQVAGGSGHGPGVPSVPGVFPGHAAQHQAGAGFRLAADLYPVAGRRGAVGVPVRSRFVHHADRDFFARAPGTGPARQRRGGAHHPGGVHRRDCFEPVHGPRGAPAPEADLVRRQGCVDTHRVHQHTCDQRPAAAGHAPTGVDDGAGRHQRRSLESLAARHDRQHVDRTGRRAQHQQQRPPQPRRARRQRQQRQQHAHGDAAAGVHAAPADAVGQPAERKLQRHVAHQHHRGRQQRQFGDDALADCVQRQQAQCQRVEQRKKGGAHGNHRHARQDLAPRRRRFVFFVVRAAGNQRHAGQRQQEQRAAGRKRPADVVFHRRHQRRSHQLEQGKGSGVHGHHAPARIAGRQMVDPGFAHRKQHAHAGAKNKPQQAPGQQVVRAFHQRGGQAAEDDRRDHAAARTVARHPAGDERRGGQDAQRAGSGDDADDVGADAALVEAQRGQGDGRAQPQAHHADAGDERDEVAPWQGFHGRRMVMRAGF